ncbi:RNA polymerase sigma factor, partial [Clostridioides difficile]
MPICLLIINSEENKSKFEQIYIKYKKLMFYTANNILKDEYLADDAVQNSFIKIIKSISKIGEVDSYATKKYILKVTENTSIDLYRKVKKQSFLFIEDVFLNSDILKVSIEIKDESNENINSIIASLPKDYHKVILLKFNYYYSNKEI